MTSSDNVSLFLALEYKCLKERHKREAAEYAYVIAMLAKNAGRMAKAYDWAEKCISLLEECPSATLEECAAEFTVEEDIALPSIFHADVVRERFKCFPGL